MAIGMTEIELIQSFKQISFLTIPVNESTVRETLLNFSQTVILFLSGGQPLVGCRTLFGKGQALALRSFGDCLALQFINQ